MHNINHGFTETIRYHKAQRLALTQQRGELLPESNALAKENELLQIQLEEVMANERISLFADGRYTDATILVVYELLSKGADSRQVGAIIQTVLSGLVNVAVDHVCLSLQL